MDFKDFLRNVVYDVKVELSEEFDRNFERKAFFDKKWPENKIPNGRGSLMMRSGNLRDSLIATVRESKIEWESSLPYASLHNEGGEVTVTRRMKSFFWAMYYKSSGAITKTKKKGERSLSAKNLKLEAEAAKWRSLALLPVGHVMKIQQRQIIGYHPRIDDLVENVVNDNLDDYNKLILNSLRQ